MKVERLETSSKEKSQKKKFSKGASLSSGKSARDVQAESVQGSAIRGRRQGEIPEFTHCHRWHSGVCKLVTGGCFRCESLEHLITQCPRESRDNRSQQGSGRGRSAAPLSTRNRGRGRSGPSQPKGRGGIVSETMDRPMPTAPTRAYAVKAREDHDAS